MTFIIQAFGTVIGLIFGAALSRRSWADQHRWELRKDLYLELLKNLDIARYALETLYESQNPAWLKTASESERESRIDDLNSQSHEASQAIKHASDRVGVLFLTEEALQILHKYLNAENERVSAIRSASNGLEAQELVEEIYSWQLYMENEIEAVRQAYKEIVLVAKTDLKLVIAPQPPMWQFWRFFI